MPKPAKASDVKLTSDYLVLRNLLHDDGLYTAGDTVALTDDQAEPLVLGGIIEIPVTVKVVEPTV